MPGLLPPLSCSLNDGATYHTVEHQSHGVSQWAAPGPIYSVHLYIYTPVPFILLQCKNILVSTEGNLYWRKLGCDTKACLWSVYDTPFLNCILFFWPLSTS